MKKATFAVVLIAFIGLIALVIALSVKKTKDDSKNNNPTNKSVTIAPVDSSDVVIGDANATVTMIEYSDFQCPYCIRLYPAMKKIIESDYQGKVRWVFRNFPLPFHQAAKGAAIAALAANNQGKFALYADKLAEKSQSDGAGLAASDLTQYAQDLGLDMTKFNSDLNDPTLVAKIEKDTTSGTNAGLEGTPTVYIIDKDGKAVDNFSGVLTEDQIKAKIDPLVNIK